jgi:hypothetical protein
MDDDELFDLLTAIEERVPLEDKPAWFEREAGDLDPGEYGRASLLIAAGEHWQMRGQYDEARRCFHAAREDGGETRSEPVANMLSLALDEGDEEAARAYDAELRLLARRDGVSPSTCHLVGEAYEIHDQPRLALRWFTIPFTHEDPSEDGVDDLLLTARRRVRASLGLAPDRLDALAAQHR